MDAMVLVVYGIVLDSSVMQERWFAVLAGFVAFNTVIYVALAVAKALPRVYVRDYLPRRYRRAETRSIFPDAPN